MDSNNATILALALGIPCATVLSIACLLTLRISHRQLLARRIRNPTVPTNSPAPSPPPVDPYYGIPLEQRPPRILTPLPRRPISIDSLAGIARQETVDRGISRSVSTEVPEGNPPTPPRRCQPIIIVSPSTTAAESSTVHPSTSTSDGHYWSNGRRFDVGRDIRITTPSTDDHTRDTNPTASSAPVSSSEFWDNITIPLSAYFPAPRDDDELPRSAANLGASLYRSTTGNSTHDSLYQQSRNPSPVPHASQSQTVTTAVTGQMRSSSAQDVELEFTAGIGHESPDSSAQSHNLHQSYSRPLSRDTMSISLTRQQEKAPSRNTPVDPTHQSQQSPMQEQFPSRPPSRRSRQVTPALPAMTLSEAIKFYQRTATDISVAIPEELKRAEYRELFKYYAYELPLHSSLGRDPGWE